MSLQAGGAPAILQRDLGTPAAIQGARAFGSAIYGPQLASPLSGAVLMLAQDGAANFPLTTVGITGSANITLGALTLAGTGTVADGVTGAGNITLGTLTLAGVGDVSGGPITGAANITLGALTLAATGALGPEPPPPPVTGGGGPGNARGRQRPVYMVDDKVFDSPAAAARYLASVTLPEPAPEAPRAAPKPKPKLAVQVAGEQVAVAPVIPVTATAEYTRELIQAELIQARRALQRRQRDLEEEERAAVFAVVQMLLEDGETVTFH